MAALQIEIPPALEPVSLAVVKNFLKLPLAVTTDDILVGALIQAAREMAETFTGRSLITKGYRQSLDSFPYFTDSVMSQLAYPPAYYSLPRYSTTLWNYSQMIKLLRSPLVAISKITYSDSVTGLIKSLLPALFNWQATTEYELGDQIEDPNLNLQTVTIVQSPSEDGTYSSGANTPSWATVTGNTTADGTQLVWTCGGPAPTGGFVYDADSCPPRLFPLPGQFWPPVLYVPNAVQIHFTAGYGNVPFGGSGQGSAQATDIPLGIITAILQLVADWYFNREPIAPGTVAKLPHHVEALLWNHRVLDFAQTRG